MASKQQHEAARHRNGGAVGDETFEPIVLQRLEKRTSVVQIVGVTPVIPHRWTDKAKRLMLEGQQAKVAAKKDPKNPEQDAHDATYWLDDGRPGIQAVAFKAAIADAARFFDKSVTIEMLKRSIHVFGEVNEVGDVLVPIEGEITMREDMPRNSGGGADMRYRNQIWPWRAELHIEFFPTMISHESLVTLIDASGANGVGDWRPSSPKSKTGTFGKYQVEA